jgi:alpha-galactosidase
MGLSSAVRVSVGILAVTLGLSCGSQGSKSASGTPPSTSGSSGSPTASDTWSLGNERIRLTVAIDKTTGLKVTELRDLQSNRDWSRVAQADTVVTLNNASATLGTNDSFQFKSADWSEDGSGTELRVVFEHPTARVRATRHYVCYVGAPVIETFTTFEATGASATISNLNAWRLSVPAGELQWVSGLEAPESEGGAFTLRRTTLATGQRLDLSAEGRSSEKSVPWVSVTSGGEHFFGGLMWSGAWSIGVLASSDRQEITAGLGSMTTTVLNGAAVEGPHGFYGLAPGGDASVARAMLDFFHEGVRLGRPLQPLITYNTWFASGAVIDELTTRNEIDHAAALGADLYVMDAGWWAGAGSADRFDYTSGLGRWTGDTERFPSGLRAMRDYAHGQGLKFGIWVEPERFALDLLGEDLIDERWLAKRDGRYDPNTSPDETASAQICLAHPDARAWVLDRLIALVDEVQPDYLKWDNNFWVNCNRAGHGHGAGDGNFAHVRALYEVLQTIRDLHPDLLIENCSGGGHRLDFGMARYTDVGWMDDRTGPSAHVRHNLGGLSTVFPGAYLFSFVIPEAEEGSGTVDDVPLLYRSRMPGVLGIGTGMTPEQEEIAVREIALYRQLRELQRDAATVLLTPQADSGQADGWDALEQLSAAGDAALFAYQTDPGVASIVVSPKALNADTIYAVSSVDAGPIGEASGADLMDQGVEIVASPWTAGHILLLRPTSQPTVSGVASKNRHVAKRQIP